jgi:secondary thiamine-phosphate synthase enzyme
MQKISVETISNKEIADITIMINQQLAQMEDLKSGLCNVFIPHTTAALSTADLDPGTDLDMIDAFKKLIPKLNYRHPHNPMHAPDHIAATLIGASVTLPIENGQLLLGTWQRVVLVELDGPRKREVIISVIKEPYWKMKE